MPRKETCPSGENLILELDSLQDECDSITSAMGTVMAHCASYCLHLNEHSVNPVVMRLSGELDTLPSRAEVTWLKVTERMERCYRNTKDAVEHGACGIAILLSRKVLRMDVVDQAVTPSGVDYYLGTYTEDTDDPNYLGRSSRLEVSGLLRGTDSRIRSRVQQKVEQTQRSAGTGLPAYVVVVEFRRPIGVVQVA